MKNFVTFDNAKEMLDFINDNHDLYCEETNTYVANYNSCGGIVNYSLSKMRSASAKNIAKKQVIIGLVVSVLVETSTTTLRTPILKMVR